MDFETFKRTLFEAEDRPLKTGKGAKLGIFDARPMSSTTLALHALSPEDAMQVVDKKIYRAIQAAAESLKILYDEKSVKVRRALQRYLETSKFVKEFEIDGERPGVAYVVLRLPA